ncbi:hypothetical protein AVDCRST_MAG82-258, partial [uncultured Rubrobacteraceae bacterium]
DTAPRTFRSEDSALPRRPALPSLLLPRSRRLARRGAARISGQPKSRPVGVRVRGLRAGGTGHAALEDVRE